MQLKLPPKIGLILICFLFIGTGLAQPTGIQIRSLGMVGNETMKIPQVLKIAGLEDDKEIVAEDLQQAIKNLWATGIYADVKIYAFNQTEEAVDLTILLDEFPRLRKLFISGCEEISKSRIKAKIKIGERIILSPYKLSKISQSVKNFYISEGFLGVKVETYTITIDSGFVNLIIDIEEGVEVEVESIKFHGNQIFDDDELKDLMETTREDSWFRSAHFSHDGYKVDLERIVRYYQTSGYRDAEIVRDSISYSKNRSDMFIDIWIDEGKSVYISKIGFEGNSIFTDEQLLSYLGFKANDLYNALKIQNAVGADLMNCYYDIGYLYTTITPKEIPISEDSIRITFQIDEGKEVKIRDISIAGNTYTKEKVIRRQLLVLPGQTFNKELLMRSQRDLWMLNYFSGVYPSIQPVDDENVDIVFEVQEKITTNTNFSAGWSKQSGFSGGLGLQMDNFLGNGQSLGVQSDIGQYRNTFSFNFSEPWLFGKPFSASVGLHYSDQKPDYTGYNQKSVGGNLRIGHKLNWPDDYFRIDWIYKYDRTTLSNFSDQIIESNPNGIVDQIWPLTTSSLTQVISRNSLDKMDFPTVGSNISLSTEIAGGFLGGNADYLKNQLRGDWYTSISENLVLRAGFETGIINTFGDKLTIPYLQQFFLGGGGMSSSVPLRGYIDPLSSSSDNQNGGTTLMKGGLELRYRILKAPLIYISTFAEAGDTWDQFNQINLSGLRRSAGFGIRIDVPYIGMIGIDYAYGFDTFNPVTGKTEGGWQLHFIIGRLF